MMRALWTGASGMKAQQTNVDTIANNLANVNTIGYKTQKSEFKSLLYQTLQERTTTANGERKPTTAQVGLGAKIAAVNSIYTQGAQFSSDSKTALMINGQGFFSIQGDDGGVYYTRNGEFGWAMGADGVRTLTDSMGHKVLDQQGVPITLPNEAGNDITFGTHGELAYRNAQGNYVLTGQAVGLYQFANPVGLEKRGNNILAASVASGPAMNEATTNGMVRSSVAQGFLEGSNVNVADEMVNLIIAQRAYQMNSKAITTSDTMLEEANNLKR